MDAPKFSRIVRHEADREAERVSYGGAVATPPRMDWKAGGTYTCPELQHRSRGAVIHSIVLGKRVEVK